MNLKTLSMVAALSTLLTAQQDAPRRTLEGIMSRHQAAMAKAAADPDAYQAAVQKYEAELREFLKDEAKGQARCQTRFALVSLMMYSGRHDQAKATLLDFDVANASSISCAQAAAMAQDLQLPSQKARWIEAALGKPSSFEQRMELGSVLMTALHETRKADELFAAAMKKASDAEGKARVTWYICKATREREDLPEGSYEQALRDLARDYPNTRYGQVAADRVKAMDFKVGSDPLPLKIKTLDGKTFDLAALRKQGKPALLCFLAAGVPDSETAAKAFQALHDKHQRDGLVVLGVWLDEKPARARDAIQAWKLGFAQATPPGGWDSDLALRYRMENAPLCMLIGRDGKIAGMNYLLIHESGQQRLSAAVQQAVAAR